jgi:hypothetical protein
MVRTQIQLTEEQARKLRALARDEGVSVAEIIRRSLDSLLEQKTPDRSELYARAAQLVGRFEDVDKAADLAEKHDDYLDQSYE